MQKVEGCLFQIQLDRPLCHALACGWWWVEGLERECQQCGVLTPCGTQRRMCSVEEKASCFEDSVEQKPEGA